LVQKTQEYQTVYTSLIGHLTRVPDILERIIFGRDRLGDSRLMVTVSRIGYCLLDIPQVAIIARSHSSDFVASIDRG